MEQALQNNSSKWQANKNVFIDIHTDPGEHRDDNNELNFDEVIRQLKMMDVDPSQIFIKNESIPNNESKTFVQKTFFEVVKELNLAKEVNERQVSSIQCLTKLLYLTNESF